MSSIARAGMEDLATPASSSSASSLSGTMPPTIDADVAEAGVAQRLHQLRHDQVVGRERRDADDVDVFLERELDDRRDAPARAACRHFHAGVAQAAATMRLPRSWPSRPILVTSTRGRNASSFMRRPSRVRQVRFSRRTKRRAICSARRRRGDTRSGSSSARRAASAAARGGRSARQRQRRDERARSASRTNRAARPARPRPPARRRAARGSRPASSRSGRAATSRWATQAASSRCHGSATVREGGVDRGADALDAFARRRRRAALPWSRNGSTASPAACRPARRSRAPRRRRSRAAAKLRAASSSSRGRRLRRRRAGGASAGVRSDGGRWRRLGMHGSRLERQTLFGQGAGHNRLVDMLVEAIGRLPSFASARAPRDELELADIPWLHGLEANERSARSPT